jgi:hypothetical protein
MLYLVISSAAFTLTINTFDASSFASSFAPRIQALASTQTKNTMNGAIVEDVDITASLESLGSFYSSMVKITLSDIDIMVLSYTGKELIRTMATCHQAYIVVSEWINNIEEHMDMVDFYNFTARIESISCSITAKSA